MIERHRRTQFIVLHVGNYAEDLANVSAAMDRFPNMNVEIAARVGELGRQPRTARKFFDRYQDRILFGTDAVPNGRDTPQQVFGDLLYQIYFRFLETEDEYFDYAPAPVPPQGRWRIYGLGLPEGILKKVYNANAARLLGVTVKWVSRRTIANSGRAGGPLDDSQNVHGSKHRGGIEPSACPTNNVAHISEDR